MEGQLDQIVPLYLPLLTLSLVTFLPAVSAEMWPRTTQGRGPERRPLGLCQISVFNKYFLSTYYILGTEEVAEPQKRGKAPTPPRKLTFKWGIQVINPNPYLMAFRAMKKTADEVMERVMEGPVTGMGWFLSTGLSCLKERPGVPGTRRAEAIARSKGPDTGARLACVSRQVPVWPTQGMRRQCREQDSPACQGPTGPQATARELSLGRKHHAAHLTSGLTNRSLWRLV